MTQDTIVERLCRLPSDEYRIRTPATVVLDSMAALIQRSGYCETPEALTRERVAEVLRRNPQLIRDWLLWSGDQRWPEGWCFDRKSDHHFTVYFFPGGLKHRFSDEIGACAEYVV